MIFVLQQTLLLCTIMMLMLLYPRTVMNLLTTPLQKEGSDAVYPFGCGIYQWAVNYGDQLLDKFLSSHDGSDFDFDVLTDNKVRIPSSIGWGQMITKSAEVSVVCGMKSLFLGVQKTVSSTTTSSTCLD